MSKCILQNCNAPQPHKNNWGKVLYCSRHYQQLRNNGKIFDTIYDPRPAIIEGDIAKIPLGVKAKNGYTIVDKEFAWIDKYKWFPAGKGYPMSYLENGSSIRMHHLVKERPKPGLYTDHINGDPTDNRLTNLRICTMADNTHNARKPRHNTSGFKGIYQRGNNWCAKLVKAGKQIHIGTYNSKEAAAKTYDEAALKYFGDYARLNFNSSKIGG